MDNRIESEYQIQLYGYDIQEVIKCYKDFVDNSINMIDDIFKNKGVSEENVASFKYIVKEQLESSLNTFKDFIYQELLIPSNVLLPEDSCQKQQYRKKETETLEDEIKELEETAKKKLFTLECLKKELLMYEQIKKFYYRIDEISLKCKEIETNLSTLEKLNLDVNKIKEIMKLFNTKKE